MSKLTPFVGEIIGDHQYEFWRNRSTQPPIQLVPGAISPGLKDVKLTIHFLLVSSSRLRGAIPPPPQYVFIAWYLVKHRDNFTLPYWSDIPHSSDTGERNVSIIMGEHISYF